MTGEQDEARREWWCEAEALGVPALTCDPDAPHGPPWGWREVPR